MKFTDINKLVLLIILFCLQFFSSCQKETPDPEPGPPGESQKNEKAILIDASKDGGVWWFPQGPSTGFSEKEYHQGKALADYLKDLGYKVDELPRGATITTDLLKKYSKVIRPQAFFSYAQDELNAYETFLNESSSLLLMSDHMTYATNDGLSASLGLMFEGVHMGPDITSFQPHPVTAGVYSLPFIAGSFIKDWDPLKITVLGTLTVNTGVSEITVGAMGIVHHKTSKIFFIGDTNGIEFLPQPFTSNLVNWLFN